MKINRRKIIGLIIGCLLIAGILWYKNFSTSNNVVPLISPALNTSQEYLVTRVIDGDTIEIETGEKVRYIGMNTPETVDPRQPVQCFGEEASAKNKEFVLNKKVKLVKDVSETDKYGRLLRFVYLEDGTLVNLELVKEGFAQVMTIPPDVAHSDDFVQAAKEAREAKRGLWGACQ